MTFTKSVNVSLFSKKRPGSEGKVDVVNVSHLEEHQDANDCTSPIQ
jgi:hypothetical protein